MSRKFVCFRSLLVRSVMPVNGWQTYNTCPFYTDLVEMVKHCFWSCDFAMEIWKRIITLLILVYPRVVYMESGIMGDGTR